MTTTLTQLGEDLALILDREMLKAHGINGETRLTVFVDETGIHALPASDSREERVLAAAKRVMDLHDETFRKLAQ
jgi:hypothetical protein